MTSTALPPPSLSVMRGLLLGHAAIFSAVLALSTCLTGSHVCPRTLDCARAGRHFCQQGSTRCGPCLHPLVENSHGHCVARRRQAAHSAPSTTGQLITSPELDEEIDFLSAIISEQRTESRLPAPSSKEVSWPKSTHLEVFSSFHEASSTEMPSSQSTASPTTTTNHTLAMLNNPIIMPYPSNDRLFIILSSVFIVAGSLALIIAGTCWVRLQKGVRLTRKVDYPVYGLMTAQTFEQEPGDKKLAHSAQMYHYQHQKQQMLSLEKHRDEPKVPDSGASSDEENEDGDFTVYECPGLAPTGEMEVMNPLFDDTTLHFQRLNE